MKIIDYLVDLSSELVPLIREVRRSSLASTLVRVAAMVLPDWLIKIELMAVVPG